MREELLSIIHHYGINHQLKKLNEECYEFIEAVQEFEKKEDIKSYEHLQEEFADVMVVLEQFKAYYLMDNDEIIDTMKYKIKRTLARIEHKTTIPQIKN